MALASRRSQGTDVSFGDAVRLVRERGVLSKRSERFVEGRGEGRVRQIGVIGIARAQQHHAGTEQVGPIRKYLARRHDAGLAQPVA